MNETVMPPDVTLVDVVKAFGEVLAEAWQQIT